MSECQQCSSDRWDSGEGCINGSFYGWCESENCYGMCEYLGECGCECHNGPVEDDGNSSAMKRDNKGKEMIA